MDIKKAINTIIFIQFFCFSSCNKLDSDFDTIKTGLEKADMKYYHGNEIEIKSFKEFKFGKLKSDSDFRFVLNANNTPLKGFMIYGLKNVEDYSKCAYIIDSLLQRGYFISYVEKKKDSCIIATLNKDLKSDTIISRRVW